MVEPVTVSIPKEVSSRIESLKDETGWNRSQTFLKLLTAGFMVLEALAAASRSSHEVKVPRASLALLEEAAQKVKQQPVRKVRKVKG